MSNSEILAPSSQEPYLLSPVIDVSLARQRLQEFQAFVRDYLVEGEDFGRIPGAPKPTLLKPGADKLCELYGLADDYEFVERVENFDKGLFDYTIKCILTDRRRGILVSSGLGSCNSLEQKYRWRDSKRVCPQCGKDTIIKGKAEYGGGWLCFAKKGGCGAKFSETDESITGQPVGRTLNEDIADLKNTILKMAKKRAKVDATLSATRSSGVFTQDIEDMPHAAAVEPSSVKDDDTSEQDRIRWLDLIVPTTPEQFLHEGPAQKLHAEAKNFISCYDDNLLSVVFNRLEDADVFSAVLVPMQKIAMGINRKDFVTATANEAKRRGYKVNRTTGTYEEGASK